MIPETKRGRGARRTQRRWEPTRAKHCPPVRSAEPGVGRGVRLPKR